MRSLGCRSGWERERAMSDLRERIRAAMGRDYVSRSRLAVDALELFPLVLAELDRLAVRGRHFRTERGGIGFTGVCTSPIAGR